MTLRAVLWDVDGTIAETERDGHRVAFNRAFEALDLPWRWNVAHYGELLGIAGGEERLRHDLARRSHGPSSASAIADLARTLHRLKNDAYARLVTERGIALRPGVARLMDACVAEGMLMGIATTTSRANVAVLLRGAFGPPWADRFSAIVCADDAPAKKPDPLVYRLALARLGIAADEAIALEDSPNGVDAARAAGIPVVVTRSEYFSDAVYDAAVATCDDLDAELVWLGGRAARVDLDALRAVAARV